MSLNALRQQPGVAAQPPAETTGFVFNHTMLRVKDITASLDFYTRVLGFRLVDRRVARIAKAIEVPGYHVRVHASPRTRAIAAASVRSLRPISCLPRTVVVSQ